MTLLTIDRSKLQWPLPPEWNTVSLPWYAPHRDVNGNLGHHAGMDIHITKLLVPVYAMADGWIEMVNPADNGPAGRWILIRHTNLTTQTIWSNVQHLDRFPVKGWKSGDPVKRGQVVAWTGDTGYESGLCCHVGFAYQATLGSYADPSKTMDPMRFLTVPAAVNSQHRRSSHA